MKKIITLITLILSFNALSVGSDGTENTIQVCTKVGSDGTELKVGSDGTELKVGSDGTEDKTYCQIVPVK